MRLGNARKSFIEKMVRSDRMKAGAGSGSKRGGLLFFPYALGLVP